MFALVSPEKTQLPPGSVVRLPATWDEYQRLCVQIAYERNTSAAIRDLKQHLGKN